MKFIDWFAGIGGFRKGMELAGHECVGFCEYDKFAVASYTSMHLITEEQREYLATLDLKKRQKEILKEEYRNGEWYADDIRRVHAGDIPRADCWCFGFPCQDISVAGKQVGFYGNRSSLFFRVMYLLGQQAEEKKPTYLFIENVKNLLSVNGGWDFSRLLVEMDRGGYDAEWQVLNSKYFGVPQNRERCFIIGHLRGRSTAEVFPIEGTNGANHIHGIGHRDGYRRNTQIFEAAGGGRGHHTIEVIGKCDSKRHSSMDVHSQEGIMSCVDALHEPKRVAIPVLTPERGEKRQNGRRFKEDGDKIATALASQPVGNAGGNSNLYAVTVGEQSDDDGSDDVFAIDKGIRSDGITEALDTPEERDVANCIESREDRGLSNRKQEGTLICVKVMANTLDTSCNQGIFVQISEDLTVYAVWYPKKECYVAIRKLTPKECFRLQGWSDDDFEKAQFVNSDSQLYKQAGNGVTVNVTYEIGKKLKEETPCEQT